MRFNNYETTGELFRESQKELITRTLSVRIWELVLELFNEFQGNPDLPAVKLTVPFNGRILPSIRLSDHASFWDQGFKAVMVTDSAFFRNPHYHLPSDTMDKLDYRFMAELVESLLLFFRSHLK